MAVPTLQAVFYRYKPWPQYAWARGMAYPPPNPVLSAIVATTGQPIANRTTVTWTSDLPGDSTLNYGLTVGMGTQVTNAAAVTAHSLQTNPVSSGLTYYYTVTTKTADGGSTTSAQQQFTMP